MWGTAAVWPGLTRGLGAWSVVMLLVAGLFAGASTTATASPDPYKDHAKLPRECALPRDLIPQKPTRCNIKPFKADRPTIVLWGDSHAWMMTPALKKLTKNQDVNLVGFFLGSCPPMKPGLRNGQYKGLPCLKGNDKAARFVRRLDEGSQGLKVVLGGSWDAYLRALDRQAKGFKRAGYGGPAAPYFKTMGPKLFRWLGNRGIDTDVVGQVAIIPRKSVCQQRVPWGCDVRRGHALPMEERTSIMIEGGRRLLGGGARVIDVNQAFCDASFCRAKVGPTNTWFDYLHLSGSRARDLTPYFQASVDDVLRAGR